MKRALIHVGWVAVSACVLDSSHTGSYGAGFTVDSAGTVALADDVVRMAEACGDGQVIVGADGAWSCAEGTRALVEQVQQGVEAAVASLEVCPAGYEHDTQVADIVVCSRGDDEMVRVGDFWVDRYEASVWGESTCTGSRYGAEADDYPPTFPDTGNWTAPLYSCSVAGVLPSRALTWFQAAQACALSGKHLITNAEWQASVAGTWDPVVDNDGSAGGACHTDGSGPRATGNAGAAPGGETSCISRWGAEDMIGNLWEWTALWETEAGRNGSRSTWPDTGAPYNGDGYVHGGEEVDPEPGDPGSHRVRIHEAIPQGTRLPAPIRRGGFWGSGTEAGAFTVAMSDAPSHRRSTLGFRCARR